MDIKTPVPESVKTVLTAMSAAGFDAYLVGGCVRDSLLGREPHDYDVTTNAKPEEIQAVFPESFYKNTFGTVSVKTDLDDLIINIKTEEAKLSPKPPVQFNSVIRFTPGQPKLKVTSWEVYKHQQAWGAAIEKAQENFKNYDKEKNQNKKPTFGREPFDTPEWRAKNKENTVQG